MATVFFQFQSTHSLRSATIGWLVKFSAQFVSIHALLAECDGMPNLLIRRFEWFQSTHSLRSATGLSNLLRWRASRFNPRTPCGVRQETTRPEVVKLGFQSTHSLRSATCHERKFFPRYAVSIHALLAECDGYIPSIFLCTKRFQSTHSLRSATWPWRGSGDKCAVSIHALLAECDVNALSFSKPSQGFNPRTPCGVRHPERKSPSVE